jgi:hypothetical protein
LTPLGKPGLLSSDCIQPQEVAVSEPKSAEHLALALFAEAIGDRGTRRQNADNPLELMKQRLLDKDVDFDALPDDAKQAFDDLFGDLSFEELRILGRLQEKMAALDPDGTRGLTEVVIGSSHLMTKL